MSCECCETRDLFVGYDISQHFDEKSFLDIIIDPDEKVMDIRLCINGSNYIVDDSRQLNYCPNCGRKLGEKN